MPVARFRSLFLSLADSPVEYQVKAAFLLNFTKFIDWPEAAFASKDSPITICILGKDPFGPVLDEIVQGETVNARKVTVQRISQPPINQPAGPHDVPCGLCGRTR